MNSFSLLVSTSSQSAQWQLTGILGTSTSVLCGWQQAPPSVEGGIPNEVAEVISKSMCRDARVSFLFNDADDIAKAHSNGKYSIQPIAASTMKAMWSGTPSRAVVVTSNDPKVVNSLFDASYFNWSLQGQIVFLSSLSEPVPDLKDVLSCASQKKYEDVPLKAIDEFSLSGIMRPGVDGDVAGFLFRTVSDKESFLRVLREEAESNGMQFKICNEAEFMDSLADESIDTSNHSEH